MGTRLCVSLTLYASLRLYNVDYIIIIAKLLAVPRRVGRCKFPRTM